MADVVQLQSTLATSEVSYCSQGSAASLQCIPCNLHGTQWSNAALSQLSANARCSEPSYGHLSVICPIGINCQAVATATLTRQGSCQVCIM